MNPAALKANLGDLPKGATIIVDTHDFTDAQPRPRPATPTQPARRRRPLGEYAVHPVDLTGMTVEAVKEFGLSRKDAARAKNMFALGLLSWMYGRPTESTIAFLERRFAKVARHPRRQRHRVQGGWNFGETTETFVVRYEIKPAPMAPGTYRNITGNLALAYGLIAGGVQSGLPVFLGLLPDHPGLRHPPRAEQAQVVRRDDVPGRGRDRRHRRRARCRPSPARLGVTTTSGPGIALKSETIGLGRDDRAAAARRRRPARRPLHRACPPRPSRPTCCRPCSAATASRRSIVAPQSPGDCFDAALEAASRREDRRCGRRTSPAAATRSLVSPDRAGRRPQLGRLVHHAGRSSSARCPGRRWW